MKVRDRPDDNQSIIRTTEAILKLTNSGEHPITYSDLTVELGGILTLTRCPAE